MSEDFDVISGPPASPLKIKPAAPPPAPEPRRSDAATGKVAALPKEPATSLLDNKASSG